MPVLVNRARMTTATSGTGTISLGAPVAGFQSFSGAGVSDGDTVRYVIEDGSDWEIGEGAYSASGPSLARGPVESSIGGAPIALSGAAQVYVTATAEDIPASPSDIGAAAAGHVHVVADITDFPVLATVATSGAYGDLTGRPTLGTAAPLDVAATGDAAAGEIVKGDDSRLSDARAPTGHVHTLADITDVGSAAASSASEFATAAQGALADSAVQPGAMAVTFTAASRTLSIGIGTDGTLPLASATDPGLMAAADKGKLDGIDANATADQTAQEIATLIDADTTAESTLAAALAVPTSPGDIGAAAAGHSHVVADITDFPALGTAAALDVAATGDAATGEIVKGDDSRLSDARAPTAHTHTLADISDSGSQAAHDQTVSTSAPSGGSDGDVWYQV